MPDIFETYLRFRTVVDEVEVTDWFKSHDCTELRHLIRFMYQMGFRDGRDKIERYAMEAQRDDLTVKAVIVAREATGS